MHERLRDSKAMAILKINQCENCFTTDLQYCKTLLGNLKYLCQCGSVEIVGYALPFRISLDNSIITHTSSKLINAFECGFVLWSCETEMMVHVNKIRALNFVNWC